MNVTINIDIRDIVKDISTLVFQQGEVMEQGELRYILQGIMDDDNSNAVLRNVNIAANEVLQVVSAYLVNSSVSDKALIYELVLPELAIPTAKHLLPSKIREYIVNYVIGEWLFVNSHPNATFYTQRANLLLMDIRHTLNMRKTVKYDWL